MTSRSGVLDHRFTFEYDVGLWTFGTVQVIKERATGALRTCKAVPKSSLHAGGADAVNRIRKLQQLRQRHICGVMEVIEDAANIFIISEKLPGGDVGEWTARVMEEGNWLQERTVAEYIRQTLIALTRAHASGVRHGDMRPSSLVLTSKLPDAAVLLCDLGLADALDPEGSFVRWNANPYTAPELLAEGCGATSAADLWSLGAVAHALLVGHAPSQEVTFWRGRKSYIEPRRDGSSWVERSPASYDFVKSLLQQADARPTAAAALQHPWLRGHSDVQSIRQGIGGEAQHSLLCYCLSILLMPEIMKPRDLRQLLGTFENMDADGDGFVSAHVVPRILAELGVADTAGAVAATEIVDLNGTESLDACGVACAYIVTRLSANAAPSPASRQTAAQKSATDVARHLVKCFFQTYAEDADEVETKALSTQLRSSAARDVQSKLGVRYSEMLSGFPSTVNRAALAQELVAGGGRGTPLGLLEEVADSEADACPTDVLGIERLTSLLGTILRSCAAEAPGKGHSPSRGMMLSS